jgi:predicted transcriptional regulator
VEILLQRLEEKLTDFHRILPRKDCKRSLVNWAANVMKMLIGTATIADVNRLLETLDELKHQSLELAHSVDHQVTYIQKLKTAERVYLDSVANLLSTVKEHMVQAHHEFQNFAHELMLFNISFLTQFAGYIH